jgi:hypothetical protein
MTPIQIQPFSLAMIEPGSLVLGALLLALSAALVWAARRANGWLRLIMCGAALLLLIRVVLVCNPWSWEAYAGYLGGRDVGWRQRDVIIAERNNYLKKPAALDYLAVGSSQAGAIFWDYGMDHKELDVFMMAGLFPLDYVLYRDYIFAYRPRVILLYLSDFDMARVRSTRRVVMAPSQGIYLPLLFAQLRGFPQGRDYDQAILEMAVGEVFPEFRYGFIFRGLLDKGLGKKVALREESPPAMPEEMELEVGALDTKIAAVAGRIKPDSLDFNFFFLEEFIKRCTHRGIEVVIVEGQYMPAAQAVAGQAVREVVRERMQALAASRQGVAYLPREAVLQFDDEDFTDISHVKPQAGYEFSRQLLSYLNSRGPITGR